MKMKKLYRDDTLSSRKITHVLSPLPGVAGLGCWVVVVPGVFVVLCTFVSRMEKMCASRPTVQFGKLNLVGMYHFFWVLQ